MSGFPSVGGVLTALKAIFGAGGLNGTASLADINKTLTDKLDAIIALETEGRDNTATMVASLATAVQRLGFINTSTGETAGDVSRLLLSVGEKGERNDALRLLTDSRTSLAKLDTEATTQTALADETKFLLIDELIPQLFLLVSDLGVVDNAPKIAQLLESIRACTCGNDQPPVDPNRPTDLPALHGCIPANARFEFCIIPSDYYDSVLDGVVACPTTIPGPNMSGASIVQIPSSEGGVNERQIVWPSDNGLRTFYATTDNTTVVLDTLRIERGFRINTTPAYVQYAGSEEVLNLIDSSSGCKQFTLNSETGQSFYRFQAVDNNAIIVPGQTVYVYSIPAV